MTECSDWANCKVFSSPPDSKADHHAVDDELERTPTRGGTDVPARQRDEGRDDGIPLATRRQASRSRRSAPTGTPFAVVERLEGRDLPASGGMGPPRHPPAGPETTGRGDPPRARGGGHRQRRRDHRRRRPQRAVLGVRVEAGVAPAITGDTETLVFAIDGAVAKARTGAFFGNNQAPLTSRTIQFISQSTMTQREVESTRTSPTRTRRCAGPASSPRSASKGHFPPGVLFTPQVDLFAIEHTNRDSIISPGPDRIRGTADDIAAARPVQRRPGRSCPPGQDDPPRRSRTASSPACCPTAQSRGIATLPGRHPDLQERPAWSAASASSSRADRLRHRGELASRRRLFDPTKPDRSLEAEFIAFAAAGGQQGGGRRVQHARRNGARPAVVPAPGVRPALRPHRPRRHHAGHLRRPRRGRGPENLVDFGRRLGLGDAEQRTCRTCRSTAGGDTRSLGRRSPSPRAGWSCRTTASTGPDRRRGAPRSSSAGIAEAQPRPRRDPPAARTARPRMVFAVTDPTGDVLGLFRMPDATSSRSTWPWPRRATSPTTPTRRSSSRSTRSRACRPGTRSPTARSATWPSRASPRASTATRRARSRSSTTAASIRHRPTGRPAAAGLGVPERAGLRRLQPGSRTSATRSTSPNQNGIVFFPGSAPLYKDIDGDGVRDLVGGFGVSGDGVDQDDVVTFGGDRGFERADQLSCGPTRSFVRGVRLPYQKFNRQPHVPTNSLP